MYDDFRSLLTVGSTAQVLGSTAQFLRSFACPENIREEADCAVASHTVIDDQPIRFKTGKKKKMRRWEALNCGLRGA
jgi:hypothetical protein